MLKQKSKYLSLLLRHKPEQANLTMDKNGWVEVKQITENTDISLPTLLEIVKTDEKGRYQFNEDGSKIRAVQGHSIQDIEVEVEKAIPPGELYHGTKEDVMLAIAKDGLKPMNRQFVHLSADVKTAQQVADRRKGKSIILVIDSAHMRAENYKFYRAANGVWLTKEVPAKFITLKNK